ncbi:MAG: prepilin-type N-terminal cleavage/methylation domain-containing protein [Bdellovibrionaceae bacterium]|nr:prepilin-type N-terminal cleavage/methylation domain-containing protein [Pseudobdellovibrionaceae bacterium]
MFKLNNKGFSLVELMVVVAIIGILSSIAIPSINKYMAKARQSEAKTNLASIYTANKAFFAEYNIYDSRFEVIGYRPEGKLRYNAGWTQPGCAIENFGYNISSITNSSTSSLTRCLLGPNIAAGSTCTVLTSGNYAITRSDLNCTVGSTSFRAEAIGNIGSTGQDSWTIDNNKSLTNALDGTN